MNKDIKILISTHKLVKLPNCKQFYGISVGQALDFKNLKKDTNIYYSDSEEIDNISNKNWFYCEITAQYYAYKHLQAEYFGFMHYRRLLSFTDFNAKEIYYNIPSVGKISKKLLHTYKITTKNIQFTIEQYDIIVPNPYYMPMNIYQQYAESHNIDAFIIALKILHKKYPHMWKDAKEHLKQNYIYLCNIFIFKNDIFQEYSKWLFDILFTMEAELVKNSVIPIQDIKKYARLGGFIAERLCSIYIDYLIKKNKYKILHLPMLLLNEKINIKHKILNSFFPPLTKRRTWFDKSIKPSLKKLLGKY